MADCLHIRCEVYPTCQMDEPRCPATNELRGLRCDRPRNHTGCHVQDDGAAEIGWGFTLAAGVEAGRVGEQQQ